MMKKPKRKYDTPEKRMKRIAFNLRETAKVLVKMAEIIETEEDSRKVLEK